VLNLKNIVWIAIVALYKVWGDSDDAIEICHKTLCHWQNAAGKACLFTDVTAGIMARLCKSSVPYPIRSAGGGAHLSSLGREPVDG